MFDDWDEHQAAKLVGKHALVGLTYVDADGTVSSQIQIHGLITTVNETIIVMRLHGSEEEFTLPPALEAFESGQPGEYRLRSTGEVVVNPDLLGTFTITASASKPDEKAPREHPAKYVPSSMARPGKLGSSF
jgi:hypothetical protein